MKFKAVAPEFRYIKRLQMLFDFTKTKPAEPELPDSFEWVPWSTRNTEDLGRVLYLGFRNDLDGSIFPTFRQYDACRRLAYQLAAESGFLPESTWLIRYRSEKESSFCAMIQASRNSNFNGTSGTIHNITVVPGFRHLGLGRAIVLKSLAGFRLKGCSRVFLEATAQNSSAVNMYRHIGFQVCRTTYKEVLLS